MVRKRVILTHFYDDRNCFLSGDKIFIDSTIFTICVLLKHTEFGPLNQHKRAMTSVKTSSISLE